MAFAAGKAILVGEHAVVYGCPALAVGLDHGATAHSAWSERATLSWGPGATPPGDDDLKAYRALLDHLGASDVATKVNSGLPHGVGLGGSAAVGVAVARAVLELLEPQASPLDPRVLAATHRWEAVFHGQASGVDATCAFLGGCIRFQRGAEPKAVPIGAPLEICIAVSGPAPSTKRMVEAVAARRQEGPARFEDELARFEALAHLAEETLVAGSLEALGGTLDRCHERLCAWDLSTRELDAACATARAAGALGAKLTGAGGGGCVLALARPGTATPIVEAWSTRGLHCFVKALAADKPNPLASAD